MAVGWWLIFDPQPQLPHDMAALLMTVVCRKGAEGIGVSNNNNDAHQFDWLVIMIGSGPSLFLAHSLPVAPLLPHVFRVELHWTWSWIVGNSKKRKHILDIRLIEFWFSNVLAGKPKKKKEFSLKCTYSIYIFVKNNIFEIELDRTISIFSATADFDSALSRDLSVVRIFLYNFFYKQRSSSSRLDFFGTESLKTELCAVT